MILAPVPTRATPPTRSPALSPLVLLEFSLEKDRMPPPRITNPSPTASAFKTASLQSTL